MLMPCSLRPAPCALQDTMSRVSQLQQENLELKAKTETEPEPDLMQDVIQSQLQTLMTERARLAEENARLSRENAGLQVRQPAAHASAGLSWEQEQRGCPRTHGTCSCSLGD